MDRASLHRWEGYTRAKDQTFLRTDTDHSPWIKVKGNHKKRQGQCRAALPEPVRLRGQGTPKPWAIPIR